MDAKIQGNRVSVQSPRMSSPDLAGGVNTIYNAQRQGMSELAQAHANVGKAIASCGEMLMTYDQHSLKKEYAADMRMFDVRFAEAFSALDNEAEKTEFANSDEFKAWYSKRSAEIAARLKQEAKNGANGFLFRNYDRWATEIDQTADVQSAVGMIRATEQWINRREAATARVNSERLKVITATGTVEDVKEWHTKVSEEDPSQKEIYSLEAETAITAIRNRDAGLLRDTLTAASESEFVELDEKAERDVKSVSGERKQLKEGMLPSESAQVILANRKANALSAREQKEAYAAAYLEEADKRVKERVEDYRAILKEQGLDEKAVNAHTKKLENELRQKARQVHQARVLSFNAGERDAGKEAMDALAKTSGDYWDFSLAPGYETIEPSGDACKLGGTETAGFAFVGEEHSDDSRTSLAYGLCELSKIKRNDPEAWARIKTVLEEARLYGITKEDYGYLWDQAVRICKNEENTAIEAIEGIIVERIKSSGILGKDEKKLNTLSAIIDSPKTPEFVDEFLIHVYSTMKGLRDPSTARGFVEKNIPQFANELDVEVLNANYQKSLEKIRNIGSLVRDNANAQDFSGSRREKRLEARRAQEKAKAEAEERIKQEAEDAKRKAAEERAPMTTQPWYAHFPTYR